MKSERQKKLDWHHNSTKRQRAYKVFAVGFSAVLLSIPLLISFLA